MWPRYNRWLFFVDGMLCLCPCHCHCRAVLENPLSIAELQEADILLIRDRRSVTSLEPLHTNTVNPSAHTRPAPVRESFHLLSEEAIAKSNQEANEVTPGLLLCHERALTPIWLSPSNVYDMRMR